VIKWYVSVVVPESVVEADGWLSGLGGRIADDGEELELELEVELDDADEGDGAGAGGVREPGCVREGDDVEVGEDAGGERSGVDAEIDRRVSSGGGHRVRLAGSLSGALTLR
jgi:hypothetical protein